MTGVDGYGRSFGSNSSVGGIVPYRNSLWEPATRVSFWGVTRMGRLRGSIGLLAQR